MVLQTHEFVGVSFKSKKCQWNVGIFLFSETWFMENLSW
jgi:mannose-1-phosphate guanylyltransferase